VRAGVRCTGVRCTGVRCTGVRCTGVRCTGVVEWQPSRGIVCRGDAVGVALQEEKPSGSGAKGFTPLLLRLAFSFFQLVIAAISSLVGVPGLSEE